MSDPRTVKCRIALAVDPAGAWCAGGYVTSHGHVSDGFDYILDGLDDGEARYYVEVEVPIPTVPTIQAQAEGGDRG